MMATATKSSRKSVSVRPASNLIALIPSRSVCLNTLSNFRKKKRKSLHWDSALHNRPLSCRSRAVMAKKVQNNMMLVQSCILFATVPFTLVE